MQKKFTFYFIIYAAMIGAIGWQGYKLFIDIRNKQTVSSLDTIDIAIDGNIKQPGYYRVPKGTTHFEILQVAGVMRTSDLSPFNLVAQVEPGENINVGTLETPVAIKSNSRLEFFFGDITILSADGRDQIPQEGMTIEEGDRILTEENSQAELSLNTYSRIDMDNFAEITYDKMGIDEAGNNVTDLFQRSGVCWYQITYTEKNEQLRTLTDNAVITVAGKGADYIADVRYSETSIYVNDGLLLVERVDGSDVINLIAGQVVTIYNDGRPFQVTKISNEENLTERFSQLAKTKAELILRHMPFNFLYCSLPNVFFLVTIQFERSIVHTVRIPPQTSVRFFVQGFKTLQEAFLYGGVVFTSTLIERILNTRISKYVVFNKNDIIRTAASIGGLKVNIDDKASAILRIRSGNNILKGQKIIDFLKPSLSGYADSEQRQIAILKSIFDEIRFKNILLTPLLADQILTNLQTNINAAETMKHYNNFIAKKNWRFISHKLPIEEKKEGNKTIFEPVLDKSRLLLIAE